MNWGCKAMGFVGAVCAGAANAAELDLSGEARLTDGAGGHACVVSIPGDVHSALLASGQIPDPYCGTNEVAGQWVRDETWRIARTFDVPADFLAAAQVVLRLEDVDTFATIRVNGVAVGRTENRFRRWDFDVTDLLRPGENRLEGEFASAAAEAALRRRANGREYDMSFGWVGDLATIRKPHCHGGWDWGLTQMTVGFCGPVRLVSTPKRGLRLDYVTCEQAFAPDWSRCDVTARARVTDADGVRRELTNVVTVTSPRLWWPNGMGESALTNLTFRFGDLVVTKRLGLRKVEVFNERTADPKTGKDQLSLVFAVNGVRLFAKGADWIPCDAFDSRQTPARYRDLLESCRKANFNMIRVWGGGQYEKDAFYDLCDELGLLVWQDFMFACAVYPGDAAFLASVRDEAEHQVRRLHDHPSLAMWCGDNECIGALRWFGGGARRDENRRNWEAKTRVLAETVAALDPGRTFWPSSPCCGPGDFGDGWKDDSKGDMHYWTVWHENADFEAFYSVRPRFCSEFGFQSYPSPEVAKTFCELKGLDEPAFAWHQKDLAKSYDPTDGNLRIRKTMRRYFRDPGTFEDLLYLSQVQQALAIKTAVESWHHQQPRCMGTLYWQLNDCWPVSSWSSIEYGGKWKHLQHHARRFYAPVTLMAVPADADATTTEVWIVNDGGEAVAGTLEVLACSFDGAVETVVSRPVTVPPRSSRCQTTLPSAAFGATGDGRTRRFAAFRLKGGDGRTLARNERLFAPYRDCALASEPVRAELVSASPLRVKLSSAKPAFFVWANLPGVRGEFDDNSLTLLPDEPRVLAFEPKDGADVPATLANLEVRHLGASVRETP